jgi:hypothetical protein
MEGVTWRFRSVHARSANILICWEKKTQILSHRNGAKRNMATTACSSGVRAIGYAGATHRGSRDSAYPRACVPASVRYVNREETLQLLSRSRRCKSACVVQATGSVSLREDLFGSKEPLFTDCRSSKVSIVGSGMAASALSCRARTHGCGLPSSHSRGRHPPPERPKLLSRPRNPISP